MKISAGTAARTVILALALTNQILNVTGHSVIQIENETISEFVSLAFTIAAAVTAWWKNNSFSAKAIKADEYLAELRKE